MANNDPHQSIVDSHFSNIHMSRDKTATTPNTTGLARPLNPNRISNAPKTTGPARNLPNTNRISNAPKTPLSLTSDYDNRMRQVEAVYRARLAATTAKTPAAPKSGIQNWTNEELAAGAGRQAFTQELKDRVNSPDNVGADSGMREAYRVRGQVAADSTNLINSEVERRSARLNREANANRRNF